MTLNKVSKYLVRQMKCAMERNQAGNQVRKVLWLRDKINEALCPACGQD